MQPQLRETCIRNTHVLILLLSTTDYILVPRKTQIAIRKNISLDRELLFANATFFLIPQ